MNRKKIWLVIPAALAPYVVLFALAIILLGSKNAVMNDIMHSGFHGNAWYLAFIILIYFAVSFILSNQHP